MGVYMGLFMMRTSYFKLPNNSVLFIWRNELCSVYMEKRYPDYVVSFQRCHTVHSIGVTRKVGNLSLYKGKTFLLI